MKKKINLRMICISVFSIFSAILLMYVIFSAKLKTEVFEELKFAAELIDNADLSEDVLDAVPTDIRVTIINADGSVKYDSYADPSTLQNHLNRPEVSGALLEGEHEDIRNSTTMSESIFYYAKKLDSGTVLRVEKEYESIVHIVWSVIPAVLAVVLILVVICLIVSFFLTKSIVDPIDDIVDNLERKYIDEDKIYPELIPFTHKIRQQHVDILESANIRQEFTANVSHELKTPLTAISGYAELIENGVVKKDEDVIHFANEIHKSAKRLLNLINDIIKLSKLDAKAYDSTFEVVNFAEIVKDTVEMLSVNADKRRVQLRYQGCDNARIRIGKEFAEEITYNLIENAIKYNNDGGYVLITLNNNGSNTEFQVSDNGIGIPKEHQNRIFERFYRVDKSRSRERQGTGLGLAIVKHICELTGGVINLKSYKDEGTTISITWANENSKIDK